MCGIIGYLGNRPAKPILIEGLKKLEYRGYDSAGICILESDSFSVDKKIGPVAGLAKSIEKLETKGFLGIAHTRWATHGAPSEKNAHPHFDCREDIAVVHNGIIENYQSLKKVLIAEGHKFRSETDSEVLAHLIEKFYQGNLEEAVVKALNLVEGSYGLVALSRRENKLVAARQSSPLIVGIGDKETFVASDIPAILKHTKKVIYLKDKDIAIITAKGCKIKKQDGQAVDREIEEVKMNIAQIEKGGYKHFMLKEIFEQPTSLSQVLSGRIKNGRIKLSITADLKKIKRIIIVACGTSWHSALIGKYLIEEIARIPVEVDYASEFRYRHPLVSSGDLLIAISQSGETADTLAALREAKSAGAQTLGIVNVVGSTMTREVDSGIYLHAGPEIGVASTKAFTSQVVAIILLALYLKQEAGNKLEPKILNDLKNLPETIREALKVEREVKKIAKKFKDKTNFLYLGRGVNFPVALEGALKLKEISYIHAEGYPAAEIKHGPIALVDDKMPVVFIATKNDLTEKIISNMQEIKARGGKIIAIVDRDYEDIERLADHLLKVPAANRLLAPIVNIIPLQLLSYYIANGKGINVDKPRNLAKSVTVE
ncbi:MAG: glutamine--fructose-6-phosphate transaminase (isomerizing) [Patescibacteria group bacterium]|jgi:glucosamine--fructose-6-phosphate aminotransferase (isomerizing)